MTLLFLPTTNTPKLATLPSARAAPSTRAILATSEAGTVRVLGVLSEVVPP